MKPVGYLLATSPVVASKVLPRLRAKLFLKVINRGLGRTYTTMLVVLVVLSNVRIPGSRQMVLNMPLV
jgi:hypothetical protein